MLHLLQNKVKKAYAIILLFLTIFSICFFVIEAGHDCCGEECPICYVLEITEENIELLKILHLLIPYFATILFTYKIFCRLILQCLSTSPTLISQKIRLND